MNLKIDNLEDRLPLYRRYPRQIRPQPAYVTLEESGDISADYSGEIGNGTPMYVWHGRTIRWSVDPAASGPDLANLLRSDAVQALFARVHAGHEVKWDGNNHVGRLTDDAKEARDALESILAPESGRYTILTVWSAYEWISQSFSLEELVDAGSVAKCAEEAGASVDSNSEAITGDMEDAVAMRASELVQRHITYETSPDDVVYNAVTILVAYDQDYARLEADYIEEFGDPQSQPASDPG